MNDRPSLSTLSAGAPADLIGHPRAPGETRDEIELFLRDAYAAGCNAARSRSLVVAMEYAAREAPKLRAILAAQPVSGNEGSDTPEPTLHEDIRRDYERIARKRIAEHGSEANVEVNAQALLTLLGAPDCTSRNPSPPGMTLT